jgi:5-methylcytosine-specific restriction endonuclease McrA
MNINLIILLITGALVYNTYHDNFLIKSFSDYKKYYKIGLIVVGALGFYLMIQKNPMNGYNTVKAAQQYINVLPMDKNAKAFFQPFLSSTSSTNSTTEEKAIQRMQTAGKSTKRSVSETKKKYIASNQNWKCGECKEQLKAWFEVDHIKRLDQGGSNDVDNLVALCRNCHGKKTSMENI